jgi:hypothetical protein
LHVELISAAENSSFQKLCDLRPSFFALEKKTEKGGNVMMDAWMRRVELKRWMRLRHVELKRRRDVRRDDVQQRIPFNIYKNSPHYLLVPGGLSLLDDGAARRL